MTSTLNQYTIEDFFKCRNQKEWVCDDCMKCGVGDCCPGNHTMYRVPKTYNCICSICLEKLK